MMLNLTEAGRRIGRSRTTVKRLIDEGILRAYIDPASGNPVVDEAEVERYWGNAAVYVPHKTQLSQPSHAKVD